ncbi:hypothetical protein IQ238_26675 [Pleurocapsales cyanobacterium LEGE 06147]|nr:hypothetical protein [Pleurocapsales cyanobacterium LEGE 06147]
MRQLAFFLTSIFKQVPNVLAITPIKLVGLEKFYKKLLFNEMARYSTILNRLKDGITLVLIATWSYTGLEKLINFQASRKAFLNQPMPHELEEMLAFVVPSMELLLAFLLLFRISRWWGLLGSVLLLTVFTTYVGLIWVGAFPRVPCSCAGIFESMGWLEHLVFNAFLLLISVLGVRMEGLESNEK